MTYYIFPFNKTVNNNNNAIQLNLRPQRRIHVIINLICSRDYLVYRITIKQMKTFPYFILDLLGSPSIEK